MEEIMQSCGSSKSEKKYEEAWRWFVDYTGKESGFEEVDFGKYFVFLKDVLHYKASTL